MTTKKPDQKPDLRKLLAKQKLPPEVAAARRKEVVRRSQKARQLAYTALQHLHPHDWEELLTQAKAAVTAVEGPLPGE